MVIPTYQHLKTANEVPSACTVLVAILSGTFAVVFVLLGKHLAGALAWLSLLWALPSSSESEAQQLGGVDQHTHRESYHSLNQEVSRRWPHD